MVEIFFTIWASFDKNRLRCFENIQFILIKKRQMRLLQSQMIELRANMDRMRSIAQENIRRRQKYN